MIIVRKMHLFFTICAIHNFRWISCICILSLTYKHTPLSPKKNRKWPYLITDSPSVRKVTIPHHVSLYHSVQFTWKFILNYIGYTVIWQIQWPDRLGVCTQNEIHNSIIKCLLLCRLLTLLTFYPKNLSQFCIVFRCFIRMYRSSRSRSKHDWILVR